MMSLARHRLPLLAVALTALLAFPLGIIASHQFGDVPTTNTYHADIDALADAGVTTGCGGGNFCPSAFVTREQMAAFMNRLGALAPGKVPVVNADKVDGKDEVLGVGDVVIHQRGPWVPYANAVDGLAHGLDYTTYSVTTAASPSIVLYLDSPGAIDGVTFGIASIRVCFAASTGDINATRAFETIDTSYSQLVNDLTVRDTASAGCYTVTDDTPVAITGGPFLTLSMVLPDSGFLRVGTVTTTWTPVG